VYVHRKKDCGTPFYVGKGKDCRAFSIHGRSALWNRTVNKHGYTVEIYESGLQEWYAFELEKELISLYGRLDIGLGSLVNFTDGGDGASGMIQSVESRHKKSIASKALASSAAFKADKSKLLKRLSKSTEFKQKRNKAIQLAHNIKIIRDDGVIYNSIINASEDVGISASHICKVLKNKRNKAGGHSWKYLNESLV
jgi:hypothetical protein